MSKRKVVEDEDFDNTSVEEKRARLEKQGIDIIGIEDIVSRFLPIGMALALQLSVDQIFDLCSVSKTFAAFCHENLGVRFWKSVLLGDFLYYASGRDKYLKCIEDGTEQSDDHYFKRYLDKYGTDVITRYKRAYPYFCAQNIHGRTFYAMMSVSKIQTMVLKDGKIVKEFGPDDWNYWNGRDLNRWEKYQGVIDLDDHFRLDVWPYYNYNSIQFELLNSSNIRPFAELKEKNSAEPGAQRMIFGDARMVLFRPKEGIRERRVKKEDCEVLWSKETRIDRAIDGKETANRGNSYLPWGARKDDSENLVLRVTDTDVAGFPLYGRDWNMARFKKGWWRTAVYNSPNYTIEASIPDVLSEKPIFRIADSTGTLTRFALAESDCGSVRPFDTESGEPLCDHHFDKKLYLDWLREPIGTKLNGLCPICKT